jgi:hypothetical protein
VAAITTRMGNPHELLDDLTAAYAECGAGVARGLQGLGRGEGDACPTPGEVIGANHVGLVELAWARKLVQDAAGRFGFRLVPSGTFDYEDESDDGDAPAGLDGLGECPPGCVPAPSTSVASQRGRVAFQLEVVDAQGQPSSLPSDAVPWAPMASASGLRTVPLLSWTSKMGCWSWSLPAGHGTIGGACPGAAAGQSTSSAGARDAQGKMVLRVLNEFPSPDVHTGRTASVGRVDLAGAICQTCYATGANYKYSDNVARGYLRWIWMEWALRQPGSSGFSNLFVQTMVAAIAGADDALEGTRHTSGKKRGQWKDVPEPARWRDSGWRFFRIHDAGDFPSVAEFDAWVEIARFFRKGNDNGVQPVLFWAPTRMWAMGPKWIELVRKAEALGNFVVRPSAYSLNEHAPQIPGWAGGSTVYADGIADDADRGEAPRYYDWDCRAYKVANGPSCRGAAAPEIRDGVLREGPPGCRACWVFPQLRINYRAH